MLILPRPARSPWLQRQGRHRLLTQMSPGDHRAGEGAIDPSPGTTVLAGNLISKKRHGWRSAVARSGIEGV